MSELKFLRSRDFYLGSAGPQPGPRPALVGVPTRRVGPEPKGKTLICQVG